MEIKNNTFTISVDAYQVPQVVLIFMYFGARKSLQMVAATMKLKDAYSVEGQESDHPQAARSRGTASHAPLHTLPSLSPAHRHPACPPFPHAFPGDSHSGRPAHLCGSSSQHEA